MITYTQLKKALRLLEKYGYRRRWKSTMYQKRWSSTYSHYTVMIDLFELVMLNMLMEEWFENAERKAKRCLEEMEG